MAFRPSLVLLTVLTITACGDDRLPAFATGEPPFGYDDAGEATMDAAIQDASLDAALDTADAGDAGPG